MGFQLGMPTLVEIPRIEETVELCMSLGLSFVELNMNMPSFCPHSLDASKLRAISRQAGVGFTIHLPEELDLANFNPAMREGDLQTCVDAIEWAACAGAGLVNMHLNDGVYFTLPDRRVWIYEQYEDVFTATLVDSFQRLYALGRERGVSVAIEGTGNCNVPFLARAIDGLSKSDGFALTWDVGHDAASGYRDKAAMLKHESRVRHMHLHDTIGNASHLILTSGEVNIPEALGFARRRDISVVVEVKTVEGLTQSIRNLDPLISSAL